MLYSPHPAGFSLDPLACQCRPGFLYLRFGGEGGDPGVQVRASRTARLRRSGQFRRPCDAARGLPVPRFRPRVASWKFDAPFLSFVPNEFHEPLPGLARAATGTVGVPRPAFDAELGPLCSAGGEAGSIPTADGTPLDEALRALFRLGCVSCNDSRTSTEREPDRGEGWQRATKSRGSAPPIALEGPPGPAWPKAPSPARRSTMYLA